MLKKSRRKKISTVLNKSTPYSIGVLLIIINNLYLDKIQINQMIAHLQGKLVEKTPTHVIIDCGGMGIT
jgi:cell division protein FtsB